VHSLLTGSISAIAANRCLKRNSNYRDARSPILFSPVWKQQELREVGVLRRSVYESRNMKYLLSSGDSSGLDAYDEHGFVYVARRDGALIGSVRAVPYPFECMQYLEPGALVSYLGGEQKMRQHVEVTRLVVKGDLGIRGLSKALVTYAGIHMFLTRRYRMYFGYVRNELSESTDRFKSLSAHRATLDVAIPGRDDNRYTLFSGDIVLDIARMIAAPLRFGSTRSRGNASTQLA